MRTRAIILKKIAIKEYDELIACYTKDEGKQVYRVKSILRPTSKQASHLNVFNFSEFSLVEGNGPSIIVSAVCLNPFVRLRDSLPALGIGYFLLECFDKMVFENESDPALWDFLYAKLTYLDQLAEQGTHNWRVVLGSIRKELLEIMGYPEQVTIEELVNAQLQSLQFLEKVL